MQLTTKDWLTIQEEEYASIVPGINQENLSWTAVLAGTTARFVSTFLDMLHAWVADPSSASSLFLSIEHHGGAEQDHSSSYSAWVHRNMVQRWCGVD